MEWLTCSPRSLSVGLTVKVKTSFGEEYEGVVYSVEPHTQMLLLSESSLNPTQKTSYRILNINYIKEAKKTSSSALSSCEGELRSPRKVPLDKVRNKEANALAEAHKEVERIGVGVSIEAQRIFNALAKTLPCRWEGDTIVIFDDLRIRNPYKVQDVSGGAQTSARELERVKRVLAGEIRKLGLP